MFDIRGFINALLRKPSGGPLDNLKSATIWVQEITDDDVISAQSAIVKALVSLNKNKTMSLKQRIRVLIYLDEKAMPIQDTMCTDYLKSDEPESFHRHYLPNLLAFWEQMAMAYQQCVRAFAEAPNRKLWDMIPMVTARGLRHYSMQAKWYHLRYLPVETRVWKNLHRLYLFAEREQFDKTPVRLYPDSREETTCLAEYVRPLMLQLVNPESYPQQQINMIDRWLDIWAKSINLERDFRPHRQIYAVNLADARPGKKLRRNMLGDKYRYWGVGLLNVAINKTIEQLTNGELPVRLGLGEDCRLPACYDLMESARKHWALETKRKHERQAQMSVVEVCKGLDEILAHLKPGAQSAVAPEPISRPSLFAEGEGDNIPEDHVEHWTIENESASGFGASFTANGSAPLKIGTLLGLKPEEKRAISVGVVRRINRSPASSVYVGIERLSATPIPVELQTVQHETARGASIKALYLPEMREAEVSRCLLINNEQFEKGKVLRLNAQGKAYTIRLQSAFERFDDYARANFDVIAKH